MLVKAAQILRDNLEDIAILDVKDNGKPIWEARADMETVISSLEYYGGLAPAIVGYQEEKSTKSINSQSTYD